MGQFIDASLEAELILLEPEELRVLREAANFKLDWRVPAGMPMIDQLLLAEARKKLER